MRSKFFSLLALLIFFSSCEESKKNNIQSTGSSGEVIIVLDETFWDTEIEKNIHENLGKPTFGLPQQEAVFKLIRVNPKSLKSIFYNYRNIVTFSLNPKTEGIVVTKQIDPFVNDQLYFKVEFKNRALFIQHFKDYTDEIQSEIEKKEIERLINRNKKTSPELPILRKRFGLKLDLQTPINISRVEDDFCWIQIHHQKPFAGYQHQIDQGIMVYKIPYTDPNQFSEDSLLTYKNRFLKKYIQGEVKESYMATATQYVQPQMHQIQIKGGYAQQINGLWRMENGLRMGGPFTLIGFVHQNQLIVLDGYVYAPQFEKRELMREVEAMLKSVEFYSETAD